MFVCKYLFFPHPEIVVYSPTALNLPAGVDALSLVLWCVCVCVCVCVCEEPPIAMTSSHPGILSLDTLVRGHSCHQSVAANTHTTTSWLSILPHRQASTFNSLLLSPHHSPQY